ncbi:MAG: hypothetical protein H6755_01305 [Candidatus Omnitrophica bacterium]|nr:hypothetical protein [Candidatus Omnitrophota bacterium]MCB9747028.1 hypothetical protein [Candidatus Omnitrophota bacterium]
MLKDSEKKEMLRLAAADSLRSDFRELIKRRPKVSTDANTVDLDCVINFFNIVNAFCNHQRKPFRRIIDKNMKM